MCCCFQTTSLFYVSLFYTNTSTDAPTHRITGSQVPNREERGAIARENNPKKRKKKAHSTQPGRREISHPLRSLSDPHGVPAGRDHSLFPPKKIFKGAHTAATHTHTTHDHVTTPPNHPAWLQVNNKLFFYFISFYLIPILFHFHHPNGRIYALHPPKRQTTIQTKQIPGI